MQFTILQYLIISILTIIASISYHNFSKLLAQPIIIGALISLVLGNFEMGIKIATSIQLLSFNQLPKELKFSFNWTFFTISAIILATLSTNIESSLLLSYSFAFIISLGLELIRILYSLFLSIYYPKIIKNLKLINLIHFLPLIIYTCFSLILVILLTIYGKNLISILEIINTDFITQFLKILINLLTISAIANLIHQIIQTKYLYLIFITIILISALSILSINLLMASLISLSLISIIYLFISQGAINHESH